jgi:iron complex outermembrane recepter protein
MSELITTRDNRATIRWKLLTSASALALSGYISMASMAGAADADRPQIWIELGGQLSRQSGQDEPLIPHFADVGMQHGLVLPLAPLEKHANYSLDDEAGISFQPEDSNWFFSASLRYGRSSVRKHNYEQLDPIFYHTPNWQIEQYPDRNGHAGEPHGVQDGRFVTFGAVPIVDYHAQSSERHEIVDFQAGKDVGLGMLGRGTTSQLEFGVRIAQLTSKSKLKLYADPYPHMSDKKYFSGFGFSIYKNVYDQYYKARPEMDRSFRGLGPSLSWSGSTPMFELNEDSSVVFDWGVNASLLFGRQKTRVRHQTSGTSWYRHFFPTASQAKYGTPHYVHNSNVARSRNVTVPNFGGLIGASLKFPNAKVSIGYRADFFFGALDGGVDARKSETRGFHGPYASISIGLGD